VVEAIVVLRALEELGVRDSPGDPITPSLDGRFINRAYHRTSNPSSLSGSSYVGINVVDIGRRTPHLAPRDHLADRVLRSLEDGLDAPVVEVTDPAVDARLPGGVAGRRAIVDALHASRDVHVCSRSVGHRWWLRPPPS